MRLDLRRLLHTRNLLLLLGVALCLDAAIRSPRPCRPLAALLVPPCFPYSLETIVGATLVALWLWVWRTDLDLDSEDRHGSDD